MKQVLTKVAFFAFLGGLIIVGIMNSGSNPHMMCHQEWKDGFVKNSQGGELVVVKHVHDNGYEINSTGNIYSHIIN